MVRPVYLNSCKWWAGRYTRRSAWRSGRYQTVAPEDPAGTYQPIAPGRPAGGSKMFRWWRQDVQVVAPRRSACGARWSGRHQTVVPVRLSDGARWSGKYRTIGAPREQAGATQCARPGTRTQAASGKGKRHSKEHPLCGRSWCRSRRGGLGPQAHSQTAGCRPRSSPTIGYQNRKARR